MYISIGLRNNILINLQKMKSQNCNILSFSTELNGEILNIY